VDHFVTKFVTVDGETFSLWSGDAGYELGDPSVPGARHRLHVTELPWRYERSGQAAT
jgi:hypothetical protein